MIFVPFNTVSHIFCITDGNAGFDLPIYWNSSKVYFISIIYKMILPYTGDESSSERGFSQTYIKTMNDQALVT